MILLILAILSLADGVFWALAYFWGSASEQTYRTQLLWATLAWFVFATMWAKRKPEQ